MTLYVRSPFWVLPFRVSCSQDACKQTAQLTVSLLEVLPTSSCGWQLARRRCTRWDSLFVYWLCRRLETERGAAFRGPNVKCLVSDSWWKLDQDGRPTTLLGLAISFALHTPTGEDD